MEAELAPLAASQCVDVLHALRQRHFKPAFAAILSAEHLAIARRDVALLGVAGAGKHAGETALFASVITADTGEHTRWNHGMSSRATFFAILFRRVRPDNVANLHCKLSLLGKSRRSIRRTRFGGTVVPA